MEVQGASHIKELDLEDHVKGEATDPEGDEDKAKEAKNIIANSIKDHLIPHVLSLKTPKEMFDINIKMTLKTQLKGVKMQLSKSIQSYFTRIFYIK